MTWLLSARAFLAGVPKWVWGAAALVVAVIAFMVWLDGQKDAAVRADRGASNAEAQSTAREADTSAHEAAQGKSEEVSDGNERAKAAAADSDDPLADGLRALRD